MNLKEIVAKSECSYAFGVVALEYPHSSAGVELRSQVRRANAEGCEKPETVAESLNGAYPLGGSFYTHLWEGSIEHAVRLADSHNAEILRSEFTILPEA